MTSGKPSRIDRATSIAQRDQLRPVPSMQPETGEPIWLVQSRSDPTRVYTLIVEHDTIRCQCAQYQHQGACAHAAAVRLVLQAQQAPAPTALPASTSPRSPASRRPAPRRSVAEQKRQEEAARRERALLWTDDRPFSLFKS